MAIDANLLLQGRTPDFTNALLGGFQAGAEIRNQPMVNDMYQEKLSMLKGERQTKSAENEQKMAQMQLQDMATDAIRLKPLIQSGDMTRANVLMAERIAKIQQRGGDPSDTMAFRDALNMGQMDQAGAIQELDGVVNAAAQLGLIDPSTGAMSQYQRENLALQKRRLDLAEKLTPAQAANIGIAQQRLDLASDVDLEERKAEAGAKGRAKGESAAEKQSLAASDAPVLFGEFISAIQQQPETGIGRAYENRAGYIGFGNVEQQRAIAVADTIASQLMAYANKLPGPASDKDRVDFKASIGAYENASNREQRLAAAQQAQKSFMRLVEKYGAGDAGEQPPPVPPGGQQQVFEVEY